MDILKQFDLLDKYSKRMEKLEITEIVSLTDQALVDTGISTRSETEKDHSSEDRTFSKKIVEERDNLVLELSNRSVS